jgi:hypothetical protein
MCMPILPITPREATFSEVVIATIRFRSATPPVNWGACARPPCVALIIVPDADQPPVCAHTGAVQKECESSDPEVAFPASGALIAQLNRLMGCPKPVLSKDRRF